MSNQIIAFSVNSNVFTQHPNFLMKFECDINTGAATTVYIQLHDSRTLPANGAVPLKSWPAPAGQTDVYKEFKNGELSFKNGIVAAVSTTQGTLTVGTVNNKFDSVAIEMWNPDPGVVYNTSYVGDETTTINTLQVWTQAAGPNQLYRLIVTEKLGAAGYIYIMADDAATRIASGTRPVPVAANATVIIELGSNGSGINVQSQDAGTSLAPIGAKDFTLFQGCTILFANAPAAGTGTVINNGVLLTPALTANKGTIKAEYGPIANI